MTVRHAAALVLVGWALMVPPANGVDIDTKPASDLLSIPVWKWERVALFDREEQCEFARDKMVNDPKDRHPKYIAQLARCLPAKSK
jgi:hypothetical protein